MKPSRCIRIAGLLATAALLASCAAVSSMDRQQTARAERYNAYAGQPVDHFTWLISHRGWSAIGSNQLIAWSNFNKPYLITVVQPCPNLWFHAHAITSTGDEVRTHGDYVLASGRRCAIQSIQPIDYGRMQRDLRQKDAEAGRDSKARG